MPLTLEFNKSVSGTLGFTGSLQGTASVAVSASFVSGAYTAGWASSSQWGGLSGVPNGIVSSSLQFGTGSYTGSFSGTVTGTLIGSASFATQANSASFVSGTYTAGWASSSQWLGLSGIPIGIYSSSTQLPVGTVSSSTQINSGTFTGSLIGSASFATQANIAISASFVSGAYTAGWASSSQWLGLNGVPTGLVSSSLQFGTGSYTGSVTGALQGTASWAVSASWAPATSVPQGTVSSSTQITSSLAGTQINATGYSGSFTGSFTGSVTNAVSASYVLSSSYAVSTSYASASLSSSFATSASYALSSSYASASLSSSFATSASYALSSSYAIKANVAPIVININNTFGADLFISQIPNLVTEWDDGQRQRFDFTGYSQARLSIRVISGSLGAGVILAQYSLDEINWNSMSVAPNGPSGSVTAVGTIAGPWVPMSTASATDVIIRWATSGSDGNQGVKIGAIALHAK